MNEVVREKNTRTTDLGQSETRRLKIFCSFISFRSRLFEVSERNSAVFGSQEVLVELA